MKNKKRCSRCKKDKGFTEFYSSTTGKDGYTPWCKKCYGESSREYRKMRNRNKPPKEEKKQSKYKLIVEPEITTQILDEQEKEAALKFNFLNKCHREVLRYNPSDVDAKDWFSKTSTQNYNEILDEIKGEKI